MKAIGIAVLQTFITALAPCSALHIFPRETTLGVTKVVHFPGCSILV